MQEKQKAVNSVLNLDTPQNVWDYFVFLVAEKGYTKQGAGEQLSANEMRLLLQYALENNLVEKGHEEDVRQALAAYEK